MKKKFYVFTFWVDDDFKCRIHISTPVDDYQEVMNFARAELQGDFVFKVMIASRDSLDLSSHFQIEAVYVR